MKILKRKDIDLIIDALVECQVITDGRIADSEDYNKMCGRLAGIAYKVGGFKGLKKFSSLYEKRTVQDHDETVKIWCKNCININKVKSGDLSGCHGCELERNILLVCGSIGVRNG